jgi:hypothetical protein
MECLNSYAANSDAFNAPNGHRGLDVHGSILTNYRSSSLLTHFGSTHHEMTLLFEDFEVKEGTLCRWLSILSYLLVDCYLICVGSSRQHHHSVSMLLHQSVTHTDLLCPGTENLTISRVLCKVFPPFLGSCLLPFDRLTVFYVVLAAACK